MENMVAQASRVGDRRDGLPSEQRRDILKMSLDQVVIDRGNNIRMTLGIPTEHFVSISHSEPRFPVQSAYANRSHNTNYPTLWRCLEDILPKTPGLKNAVFRLMWTGSLCLLAVGLLAACSSEPDPTAAAPANSPVAKVPQASSPAPTPAPMSAPGESVATEEPPPTAAPTATLDLLPTPGPAESAAGAGVGESGIDYYSVNPASSMGDLFATFTESEQACVTNELDEKELASILERPVFDEEDIEGRQVAVLQCVAPKKVAGIFYSSLVANIGEGTELTGEQAGCLRELADKSDVVLIASVYLTDAPPGADEALLAFSFGMLACVLELATSGPTGQSDFPAIEDESLLWSYATGGWVLTAPAVVDGVVYVGSDDYSIYALDAATGELRWSFPTGDVIRSTPTVAEGVVYIGSNDNHLYALDSATGGMLWSFDTGDWVQYSPTVSGGMVYFGAQTEGDRKVHAVDAASGEAAWVADGPFPVGAEVTPTALGNRVYAPGAEYGVFLALNAATGEPAWTADVGGYVESAPTVLDGVVYLTVVNNAYALDDMTGEVIWQVNTEEFPARDFPALVVDGVYYLAPSDNLYALNASTGEELWSYDAAGLSTTPVVADGIVYGASELAEYMFALDAATGEELWTMSNEDVMVHSLVVSDGILYSESDIGYLFAIDVQEGLSVWEFEKGGFSDIRAYTVSDGVLYFGGIGNDVRAHAAPKGW